jgi:hypothetical protein
MTNFTDANDPDALRRAIIDFCLSNGTNRIPASANALDRHDRRLFITMRDQIAHDVEVACA